MKLLARWLSPYTDVPPYVAFTITLLASLISLSLSEVFHLVPCVLCWYQRICMYTLPVIIGTAIVRRDKGWWIPAAPQMIVGWCIATFHTLLQWGIVPDSVAPCQAG